MTEMYMEGWGGNWVETSETRREPIHGGSTAASLPLTVSEVSTQLPWRQDNRIENVERIMK
jgi:hypothetical protein